MDKIKVSKKLIKKKYISNISELHNLYCNTEKSKKEHIGYSIDCKCTPDCFWDFRFDLEGNLFEE
jgi:hypothetical protein